MGHSLPQSRPLPRERVAAGDLVFMETVQTGAVPAEADRRLPRKLLGGRRGNRLSVSAETKRLPAATDYVDFRMEFKSDGFSLSSKA